MDKLYTLYITLPVNDSDVVPAIRRIRKIGSTESFSMSLREAKDMWDAREKPSDGGAPDIKLFTGVTAAHLKEWFKKYGIEYRFFRLVETSEADLGNDKMWRAVK